jgi:hypothetical protein
VGRRNRVSVGCFAITTDSRALWKANNLNTYDVLAGGGWIDDVPPYPGSPPSPQDAGAIYERTGRIVEVDECEQMRFFRERVVEFWREHPDEKLRLAGRSVVCSCTGCSRPRGGPVQARGGTPRGAWWSRRS